MPPLRPGEMISAGLKVGNVSGRQQLISAKEKEVMIFTGINVNLSGNLKIK